MINHRARVILRLIVVIWSGPFVAFTADAQPSTAPDATVLQSPLVPPAAPGVFSVNKRGNGIFHLSVTGHTFTSRDAVEKYLAYRAAEFTKSEHANWFTFIENRAKGDTIPKPVPDRTGPRFSFRVQYWRPVWRYKTAASPTWKNWSPFSGAAFPSDDPKTITVYEASADILLHKGVVAGDNPLAFDAEALSDYLVNQVSPPQ